MLRSKATEKRRKKKKKKKESKEKEHKELTYISLTRRILLPKRKKTKGESLIRVTGKHKVKTNGRVVLYVSGCTASLPHVLATVSQELQIP
jgi:hypothetical protein